MSVSYAVEHRPAAMRRADAWYDCELRPCGEAGQLAWHHWTALGIRAGCNSMAQAPLLADCQTARPKSFRIVVWEPLITKAPGPHLAQAHCCYLQTVIFYAAPYMRSPWIKFYEANGKLQRNSSPGHFEEWDQIETRLGWHDRVTHGGDVFEHSTARVLWTSLPGERRRWWMRHGFRRVRQ